MVTATTRGSAWGVMKETDHRPRGRKPLPSTSCRRLAYGTPLVGRRVEPPTCVVLLSGQATEVRDPLGPPESGVLPADSALHTASGVTGSRYSSTPNFSSASQTALATAAPHGMVPTSPAPRRPSGVTGDGTAVWSRSTGGMSHTVGA